MAKRKRMLDPFVPLDKNTEAQIAAIVRNAKRIRKAERNGNQELADRLRDKSDRQSGFLAIPPKGSKP